MQTTLSLKKSRPYQKDISGLMNAAVQKISFLEKPTTKERCQLVVLPTGMGKTFCFVQVIWQLYNDGKAKRILCLAHKEELVDQIIKTSKEFGFPARKIDKVIRSNPRNRSLTIGTIQSFTHGDMWRLSAITPPDLVIIDECHRSAARTYQEVIDFYSKSIFFGFTATPVRSEPEFKKIFVDTWTILYNEYTLTRAISEGYLCNLKYYRINLKKLGIPTEDQNKYNVGLVNEEIFKKYREVGGGKFLVFANSVSHSKTLQRVFSENGVSSYHVDCFTKKKERRRILAEFRDFEMTDDAVIFNQGIYTEGVDIPNLRGVVIACKLSSKSIVKFLQMVGRATRNFENPITGLKKEFGVILEVRNNRSKTLTDALNKVFRLYYQDKEEYEDYDEEIEETKEDEIEEEKEKPEIDDGVVTLENAELELQNFFSPLPQTFISSNLKWTSTVEGVYFCHISKDKYFEVEKKKGGFLVYGVNTNEKKKLAALLSERDVDKFCFDLAMKYYVKTSFVWSSGVSQSWKNQPATEAQKKMLVKNGYSDDLTKIQASRILDMIFEKKRHEPISKKQQNFLYAIGFRGDFRLVNKANVRTIIKQLQGNIKQ